MFDLDRKVIFTHPQKCAGTTIEALFNWHPNTYKGDINKAEYGMFFLKWKHSSLEAHLKQLLFLREEINKYYIFSCIRNPWDRAVSWYYHHKAIAGLGNGNSIGRFSFEKFIFTSFYYIKAGAPNPLTTRPFTNSSTRKPDFIIRYENYSEDLHYITKKFNLNDSKIIPYNSQERFKKTSYREYYPNDELVSIVQELAKDSIEDFGYKF